MVGSARPGRRIVISGDTAPCQAVEVLAHEADLLVHEATFLEDERARARETGHSTARQAAEIARDAEVRMLALTHLSTRYFPRDVRDEARSVFPDAVVPRDFDAIEVPFPERGGPAAGQAGPRASACLSRSARIAASARDPSSYARHATAVRMASRSRSRSNASRVRWNSQPSSSTTSRAPATPRRPRAPRRAGS